jgi:hypothetical protein
MDYTENGAPMFNGHNGLEYEIWSSRTKVILRAQIYDVWKSVVTGYTATKKTKIATKKELKSNNEIAMDFIWEGLPDLTKEKVGNFLLAKEIWDKLHDLYFEESPIREP